MIQTSICPINCNRSVGDYGGDNGYGELGFDSGEGAWETATTSKEGSRRVNYPIPIRGDSDNKYRCKFKWFYDRNENNLKNLSRNNWRASLVPAAAVIPAPIVYIKVVVVKKLVVGLGESVQDPHWVIPLRIRFCIFSTKRVIF